MTAEFIVNTFLPHGGNQLCYFQANFLFYNKMKFKTNNTKYNLHGNSCDYLKLLKTKVSLLAKHL